MLYLADYADLMQTKNNYFHKNNYLTVGRYYEKSKTNLWIDQVIGFLPGNLVRSLPAQPVDDRFSSSHMKNAKRPSGVPTPEGFFISGQIFIS